MSTVYPDPAETTIAQRGYSAWAMMPSCLACVVLSVLFLLSGHLIDGVRGLGENTGSWVFFWITGVFWLLQILRWLYRGATYVYVLTEKRIFVERGFRWPPTPPLELRDVTNVRWGMHQLARPFGVGWIEITVGSRVEVLRGVRRPDRFALLVEKQRGQLQAAPSLRPEALAV